MEIPEIEKTRKRILRKFHHFDSIEDRLTDGDPEFAGDGFSHFMQCFGDTEISWTADKLIANIKDGLCEEGVLGQGEVKLSGDLEIKARYLRDRQKGIYVMSRDQMQIIARRHPTDRWTKDIMAAVKNAKKRSGYFGPRLDELLEFEKVYKQSGNSVPIAVLESTDDRKLRLPFKIVQPDELLVKGDIEYSYGKGETWRTKGLQLQMDTSKESIAAIPVPALVRSVYSYVPGIRTTIRRQDAIRQNGDIDIRSDNPSIYIDSIKRPERLWNFKKELFNIPKAGSEAVSDAIEGAYEDMGDHLVEAFCLGWLLAFPLGGYFFVTVLGLPALVIGFRTMTIPLCLIGSTIRTTREFKQNLDKMTRSYMHFGISGTESFYKLDRPGFKLEELS